MKVPKIIHQIQPAITSNYTVEQTRFLAWPTGVINGHFLDHPGAWP
jgi:hypothetical protein